MQLWETAVALDLPVFPCKFDKKPACDHGFKDAVRDRIKIHDLFTARPGTLIGVATGEICGFDVLDLDTARHMPPRNWLKAYGAPRTRGHQTQSGGLHFLFKHDSRLRCSNGLNERKGIDIKTNGGYIIWWPQQGYTVNPFPIADWPSATIDQFLAASPRQIKYESPPNISDARLGGVVRRIGTAINGERNNVLFWGACRVGEWINLGDLTRTQGENILISAARQCGLDDVSAEKTIASGINRVVG